MIILINKTWQLHLYIIKWHLCVVEINQKKSLPFHSASLLCKVLLCNFQQSVMEKKFYRISPWYPSQSSWTWCSSWGLPSSSRSSVVSASSCWRCCSCLSWRPWSRPHSWRKPYDRTREFELCLEVLSSLGSWTNVTWFGDFLRNKFSFKSSSKIWWLLESTF